MRMRPDGIQTSGTLRLHVAVMIAAISMAAGSVAGRTQELTRADAAAWLEQFLRDYDDLVPYRCESIFRMVVPQDYADARGAKVEGNGVFFASYAAEGFRISADVRRNDGVLVVPAYVVEAVRRDETYHQLRETSGGVYAFIESPHNNLTYPPPPVVELLLRFMPESVSRPRINRGYVEDPVVFASLGAIESAVAHWEVTDTFRGGFEITSEPESVYSTEWEEQRRRRVMRLHVTERNGRRDLTRLVQFSPNGSRSIEQEFGEWTDVALGDREVRLPRILEWRGFGKEGDEVVVVRRHEVGEYALLDSVDPALFEIDISAATEVIDWREQPPPPTEAEFLAARRARHAARDDRDGDGILPPPDTTGPGVLRWFLVGAAVLAAGGAVVLVVRRRG